jgi:arginine exporter protein ArgO
MCSFVLHVLLISYVLFFLVSLGGVRLANINTQDSSSPIIEQLISFRVHLVLRPLFGLLYQPLMVRDDECGAVGGM